MLGQTWEELLFAHWRVPAETVAAFLPDGLELDTYDGDAWLGVTPFRLSGLRLRGTLPLPYVSSFLELNVRTCVRAEDKPGIWFFSLDASSGAAVQVARRTYRLPYHRARMSMQRSGGWIAFECARERGDGVVFSGRYRPAGKVFHAQPGSLEAFLTERYCLYASDERGLSRAEVHHAPWPLQAADAEIELNTMAPVELEGEPLLHYSERLDVVIWPPEAVIRAK